jgi:single-strand DNA-binding protein
VNLNKLYLVGTLKTDPETRETHSGSSVTRVVVTVHRDYFSKERNQRVRESDSFEVQAWGPLGQEIARQLKKGSQIFVEGRLKQDSWETPTGERRQRTVVHAESFAPVGPLGVATVPGVEGAPAVAGAAAPGEDGPTPSAGPPGLSGKRKRRRRRGPRRDGLPAGPVVPQTPEERAAFAAGIADAAAAAAASSPAPAGDAPAASPPPPRAESAPAPASPPPPPPAAPAPEKPRAANVSLKDDMPF